MKKTIVYFLATLTFACSDSSQQKVETAISKTSDSLVSKLSKANDTLVGVKNKIEKKLPKVRVERYHSIPITLQWISFNKPGEAKLVEDQDGWYTLKGEQNSTDYEYLKIDGRLKRIDAEHLKFVGTIITYVKYNNEGKPCEKKGELIFLKKNNRKFYRLQKMENCSGGRVLDYVDLYEVDKYL